VDEIQAGFDDEAKRRALIEKLNQIKGVDIPETKINSRPSIPLSMLTNDESLEQFISVMDWYYEEIKLS